jgi:hypothetical protein
MISGDAAGPSSSNATAFAGATYISAPALLPAYQSPARARATPPAPHVVYSLQAPAAPGLPPPVHQQQKQQQQPVALYDFGNMVAPPAVAAPTMSATSGHQPPPQFTLNNQQQQHMFAPWRQGDWMGRRRETRPTMLSFQQPPAIETPVAGGHTNFGDAAVAHLQSQNVGAQSEPADSFDDVLRAMMEMDGTFPRPYYAPAKDKLLAATQAALGNGNRSNYNAGSFMVKDMNGGNNSASFMAPQDPAAPTAGNQVELGAPALYRSLLESPPGPSAMFNGNGDMAAMIPSNDENAMLSLGALRNFDDDVPIMHPEGQQVAAADSTAAANATGIMSNGGEESGGLGPNWNMGAAADDGLDMLEEYLMDNNASDFLLPKDMNNGHQ